LFLLLLWLSAEHSRWLAGTRCSTQEEVQCFHDSAGPPLRTILFDIETDEDKHGVYAQHTLDGFEHVLTEFEGLNLHDTVAIVVPVRARAGRSIETHAPTRTYTHTHVDSPIGPTHAQKRWHNKLLLLSTLSIHYNVFAGRQVPRGLRDAAAGRPRRHLP
jgi:hypothetical protein